MSDREESERFWFCAEGYVDRNFEFEISVFGFELEWRGRDMSVEHVAESQNVSDPSLDGAVHEIGRAHV